jgi:hypothetical protein
MTKENQLSIRAFCDADVMSEIHDSQNHRRGYPGHYCTEAVRSS